MTDVIDEWSEPGAEKYLQSLGRMSLRYNHLEIALQFLIESYLRRIPASVRDQILIPLNNNQKSSLLQVIALEMEPSAEIQDRIRHFLQGFSICANNRNIALHAIGHKGDTHFHFIKKQAKTPFDHNIYSVSIFDLEAICDGMLIMREFCFAIGGFVRSELRQDLAWDWPIHGPVEIPQKPPLPRKLVPPAYGEFHPDAPILF